MYNVYDYGRMITDKVRTEAYVQTLQKAVKPGSVVLDIGTGTGFFALLACRFGARKVYAIEPNDAIQVGREVAAANGLGERIEFIQELSTQVTLPEVADVIISDLRGVLPLLGHHLPSIADARRRLLAPGGTLIPQADSLWAAVVEAPELYTHYLTPWLENGYGLTMEAARAIVIHSWHKGRVKPEQLLAEPQCWVTVDYTLVEEPHLQGQVSWTVSRDGTGHGLSLWFDTVLAEGVGFSNAPDQPELIYNNAFLPWSEPVLLKAGDTVSVTLQANLVGEDYIWRWNSCILEQGRPGQIKANFKQSSFLGVPLSPAQLAKRAASYVPALNEKGQIDQLILGLMAEAMPLGEIARAVAAQFPRRYPTWQAALNRVGELSLKYSR